MEHELRHIEKSELLIVIMPDQTTLVECMQRTPDSPKLFGFFITYFDGCTSFEIRHEVADSDHE